MFHLGGCYIEEGVTLRRALHLGGCYIEEGVSLRRVNRQTEFGGDPLVQGG